MGSDTSTDSPSPIEKYQHCFANSPKKNKSIAGLSGELLEDIEMPSLCESKLSFSMLDDSVFSSNSNDKVQVCKVL